MSANEVVDNVVGRLVCRGCVQDHIRDRAFYHLSKDEGWREATSGGWTGRRYHRFGGGFLNVGLEAFTMIRICSVVGVLM